MKKRNEEVMTVTVAGVCVLVSNGETTPFLLGVEEVLGFHYLMEVPEYF